MDYTPGTITGIAKDIAAGKISVYPNPTTGKVFINTGGEHRVQAVQLVNVAGVKVLEQTSASGSVESLDVSGLPKGLYYMHLKTNKGSFQSKLVVR